jgi:hypothetical protein
VEGEEKMYVNMLGNEMAVTFISHSCIRNKERTWWKQSEIRDLFAELVMREEVADALLYAVEFGESVVIDSREFKLKFVIKMFSDAIDVITILDENMAPKEFSKVLQVAEEQVVSYIIVNKETKEKEEGWHLA